MGVYIGKASLNIYLLYINAGLRVQPRRSIFYSLCAPMSRSYFCFESNILEKSYSVKQCFLEIYLLNT